MIKRLQYRVCVDPWINDLVTKGRKGVRERKGKLRERNISHIKFVIIIS